MKLVETRALRIGYGSRLLPPCPDFSVGPGDFIAVAGPNGAGKTTLLKTIAGLMPPCEGSLALADGLREGGIGYLPQQKSVQRDFPASVREVVLSGCDSLRGLRPFYSRKERRMAAEAMVRFGVAELARRSFRELSGGQRQRVLLARTLAAPRKLLLLDEPATGLDPDATAELYSVLRKTNASGLAMMMVTHDLAPAVGMATHILTLGERAAFERNADDAR